MKKFILLLILPVFLFNFFNFAEKSRIGVLRFTNTVIGSTNWRWNSTAALELQDILIAELTATKSFYILKGREINPVFSDQEIINIARVSKSSRVRMKRLKGVNKYNSSRKVSKSSKKKRSKGGKVVFKGVNQRVKKGKTYIPVERKTGWSNSRFNRRVSKSTMVKMRSLKGTKYFITGTVSAFVKRSSKKGGKVRFKGLSLGGKKGKTYIAVDIKVVETETGEVVDARTIEASIFGNAFENGQYVKAISNSGRSSIKTAEGKAIRACIIKISRYLKCSLAKIKYPDCLKKWNKINTFR